MAKKKGNAQAVYNSGGVTLVDGDETGLFVDASGNLLTTASIAANSSVNISQVGGATFAQGQQLAASSLPVVLTAAQITSLTPTKTAPAGTTLNTYALHSTTNTTTTPTASTAYISAVVISTEVAGTTSTVTIQDKSGTPLKLIPALTTVAISAAPTVLSLQTPVLMTSGIDIVTAGAVAATIDVWINYFQ